MFNQVVQSLLSGEFICQVTDHCGFSYLLDAKNHHEVDAFVGRIGLHLASTRQKGAFFVAHDAKEGAQRKAAKEVFTEIKHSLRPVVHFLDMVMRVMQNDSLLTIGTLVEVNRLMAAIDENPSFRNDLQTLAIQLKIQTDGTDRARLEKVLKSFREKGYLVLSNPEREIYQITGKIEFIQEVIEFLMEHDSISDKQDESMPSETAAGSQGTLL